jgi:acetylornithine deacetylase
VTSDDPVELLERLVEKPSVSGSEGPVIGFIAGQLRHWGLAPVVSGRNVWCRLDGAAGFGRTLLFESHVDTVPPSPSWTVDPWRARRFDGRLQGLGSNDTKGSTAGMLCALRDLSRRNDFKGTLVFAATCDEETGGQGLEVLRPELPAIDGAVIGEPTVLRVASAQRGYLRLEVTCEGKAAHAARPWQGVNAIELALADLNAIREIETPDAHPVLGVTTRTISLIAGGVKSNVVPARCTYTVDIRPTPLYDNAWWEARLREVVKGRIDVLRARMVPVETSPTDPLVQAGLAATQSTDPVAFGGVSNLFFVRDVSGFVLGPGRPEQSHQADEWIEEEQVRRSVGVYTDIARRYLS